MIWKDESLFSLENQLKNQVWAIFHAKFGHKDKSFIWVTKCESKEKIIFALHSFELHPHIDEIRTDILVYENGGVIKHIKAPAIVKI